MDRRIDRIEKLAVTDTCAVWNLLSSTLLYSTCTSKGFVFALTSFVVYECLHRRRKTRTPASDELRRRLMEARARAEFNSVSISVDDLQEVIALNPKRKLRSMGELSALVFAKRVGLAFQTDDQGARRLAAQTLPLERVQTTPHVLAWLFFEGHLLDGDLATIVEEHERLERPLRPHFENLHAEAVRCRSLAGLDGNG